MKWEKGSEGGKSGIERVRAAKKRRQDRHGLRSAKTGRIFLYLLAAAGCCVTAGLAFGRAGKRILLKGPEKRMRPPGAIWAGNGFIWEIWRLPRIV